MASSKDTSKPQISDPLNPGEQPRDGSLDVGGSSGSGSIADEFSRSVNAALSGIGEKITEATGVQLGSREGGASGASNEAAAPSQGSGGRTAYEAKDEQVQDFLRDQYRSTAGDGLEKK